MTPNEIQMLCVGVAIGSQLVAGLHMFWDWRDTRRGEAATRRQMRILAADRYLNSFRLYRLRAEREALR